MTKLVRIENADTSAYKIVVEVWDKGSNGAPDQLAFKRDLDYPTAMTADTYIHGTRYIIIREKT